VRRAIGQALLGACGVLALACATAPSAPLHPAGPEGSFYVVGIETLADIAKRQGVPLEDLAEINDLDPNAPLQPGQVIFLLAPQTGVVAAAELEPPLPPSFEDDERGTRSTTDLAWPLREGRMSSIYGRRWGKKHEGIDLAAPIGTPVYAAKDGLVLYADNVVKGYGNMVVLQHEGDLLTAYAHTSVLLVRKGDHVRTGQIIARVGQTGHATAPHLHFEVRKGQVPKDPLRFLPPREAAEGSR
jgi:murein DD-endopeptidase MepM/ murein hydrolase activator NlpD